MIEPRFLWERQFQHDLAGFGVELDSLRVVIAGGIDKLRAILVANLQIVDRFVRLVVERTYDFARWRKNDHALDCTDINIAVFADGDSTVRCAERRASIG